MFVVLPRFGHYKDVVHHVYVTLEDMEDDLRRSFSSSENVEGQLSTDAPRCRLRVNGVLTEPVLAFLSGCVCFVLKPLWAFHWIF